jgi:uncharacterized phage infection (PIP) family protein YhgE
MDSESSSERDETGAGQSSLNQAISSNSRLVKIINETVDNLFYCELSPGGKKHLSLEDVWSFDNGPRLLSRLQRGFCEEPALKKARKSVQKQQQPIQTASSNNSDCMKELLSRRINELLAERNEAIKVRDTAIQEAKEARIEKVAIQAAFTQSLGDVLARAHPPPAVPTTDPASNVSLAEFR